MKSPVLALLAIVLFLPSSLAGQKVKPTRSAPRETAFLDLAEDPCFHKLLVNERVRILQVDVAPHQSTAMDQHPRDYLIVSLTDSRLEAAGSGNSFQLDIESGEMQVMKGGWPHRLNNLGDKPSHLLALEVLRGIEPELASCGLSARTCADGQFRKTEEGTYSTSTLFETPTVKLKRIYLSPAGSLPQHSHASGEVVIALTDLTLGDGLAEENNVHLASGQVYWGRSGISHGLTNVGKQEARFLELELK